MDVDEVLTKVEDLAGSSVTIEGFLIVTSNISYIAPDENTSEDTNKSILVQTNLLESLEEIAPGLIGGSAIYADSAKVRGVLSGSVSDEFPASLLEIEAVTLLRQKATFHALKKGEAASQLEKSAEVSILEVSDVLRNSEVLIGSSTRIRGFLVTTADTAYIAPHQDDFENVHNSILITDPRSLDDRLSEDTYCSGEPPYLYQEFAELEGVLCESTVEPFSVALTNLKSISLTREMGEALLIAEIKI
ncbi:hypothetical protein [Microcoleus sp. FACHB-1515]|uniref:hypothetical protein n=2 Tax=Cyanophyceae TaxID=3028117 RepID=UPI00168341D6|nr:hypothetical protein [Microcoleus sp. FACHB-1515]